MAIGHEFVPGPSPEMQSILADIDLSAESALHDYATERNLPFEEAHFTQVPGQTFCAFVTGHMISELSKKDYKFSHPLGERHVAYVGWATDETGNLLGLDKQPEGAKSVIHRYVVTNTPAGEIVADATWQQFLDPEQRSPDLPKVLAGTREGVRQQLLSWGFNDPQLLKIWEKPSSPTKPKPHAV